MLMRSSGLLCVGHSSFPSTRNSSFLRSPFIDPTISPNRNRATTLLQPLLSRPARLSCSLRHFDTSLTPTLPPLNQTVAAMDNVDSRQRLCERMRLWEMPDQYVIEPTDGISHSFLTISHVDGSIKQTGELPQSSSLRAPKIRTVYGLMGVLKLIAGSYVVVITDRECVGTYMGYPIYKVTSLQILPCNQSLNSSTSEQKKMETEFSELLNAAEGMCGLYFSYNVNLTLSAQRLYDLGNESKILPLWRQAEPRFIWNNYMLEVLIDHQLDPYLLPVIQGSFQHFQSAMGKEIIDVTLIARRCTRRTGTRMWRRGADPDGYVANFVETEQIVQAKGFSSSFVQVRGSIPILWEQIVDLSYKPPFRIVRPEEAPRVAERHFLDLRKRYGSVLAVDLVNNHGSEGRLSEKFASAMQDLFTEDVRYVHFDFHRICGHIHFDRLSLLYDQIADYLNRNGYFMLNSTGEKVKEQHGVVRTNCIDCLDRTNVTQSMIGRKILESQLQQVGIFSENETISVHPNIDESFKKVWAYHGDDISMQYAGTPALKRDLVRHGKQTVPGLLADGWNAMTRYYLNNFCDGTKQDAIDLLHGHYIVSLSRDMNTPSPSRVEALASLRLALGLILVGLIFSTMSLRQVPNNLRHLLFSLLWAGMSIAIAAYVRGNGRLFCNRPRLNKRQY
ncbi:phosphoinositide phosphatase SAC6-like [Aristolochia californica]|uniref:phosphoinositide phosphatase SAC6-like n=1 Tax=Aristolochia californica TaxID=171875 RepID=UPI0035DEE994